MIALRCVILISVSEMIKYTCLVIFASCTYLDNNPFLLRQNECTVSDKFTCKHISVILQNHANANHANHANHAGFFGQSQCLGYGNIAQALA